MEKIQREISAPQIIFPELSYKIVGAAFAVFNELGWGLPEKDYQRALCIEFKKNGVSFEKEVYIPLEYKDEKISKYFADFIIEKKILVELKVVSKLGYTNAKQVLTYLNSANIKLGILVYFTKDGIKYRRIINSSIRD